VHKQITTASSLMFTCIYCLRNEPQAIPSKAHIFPDGMGGITSTGATVCVSCNDRINKEFETNEIDKFSIFQSIWGIKGRRGKIRGVPAVWQFGGKQFRVSLDAAGEPKTPMVTVEKDKNDTKRYRVIGPPAKVEGKLQEISKKCPSVEWREIDLTDTPPPVSTVDFDSNLGRNSLRRLAAKVAFERLAQIR